MRGRQKYLSRGSLSGITMPDSDREGRIFLSTPYTYDSFFLAHFSFLNVDSFSNAVTSIADVGHIVVTLLCRLMTSLRSVTVTLNDGKRDVYYNQCIFLDFILPWVG